MTDFTQGAIVGLIVGVLGTLAVLFIWGGE
jgi:hypothetical protein